jgi:hypothetical protein
MSNDDTVTVNMPTALWKRCHAENAAAFIEWLLSAGLSDNGVDASAELRDDGTIYIEPSIYT